MTSGRSSSPSIRFRREARIEARRVALPQPRASPWDWRRETHPEAACKAALEKKRPERTAPPPSPWQKGVSIVKEHYCPPRERIPRVVEAVLLVRADLTVLDVRRWSGAAWETAVASPAASGRTSTWPSHGRAPGRTRPASPNDCRSAA